VVRDDEQDVRHGLTTAYTMRAAAASVARW
jgi:hypothetical protein